MRKTKKGATLLELVITMAAVSIMSIMVTSFCLACHSWVNFGTDRYNLMLSQQVFEKALTKATEENDLADCYMKTEDGDKLCFVKFKGEDGEDEIKLYYDFENSEFIIPNFEGDPLSFELRFVEKVLFNVENEYSADDKLLRQMVIARVFYHYDNTPKKGPENDGVFYFVYTTKVDKNITKSEIAK